MGQRGVSVNQKVLSNYKTIKRTGLVFTNCEYYHNPQPVFLKHNACIQSKYSVEIMLSCREIIVHYKLRLDKKLAERVFSTQK